VSSASIKIVTVLCIFIAFSTMQLCRFQVCSYMILIEQYSLWMEIFNVECQ